MTLTVPAEMSPQDAAIEPEIVQNLLSKWSDLEEHLYDFRFKWQRQEGAQNFMLSTMLFAEVYSNGFDFRGDFGLSLNEPDSLTFLIQHHSVLQANWYEHRASMEEKLSINISKAGVSERRAQFSDPVMQHALVTVEDLRRFSQDNLDSSKFGPARNSLRSVMAQQSRRIWQSISSSGCPLPGRWVAEDPSRAAAPTAQIPHLDIPIRPYPAPWLNGMFALKYDGTNGFKCADSMELRHYEFTGGTRLIDDYELDRYFTMPGYRSDKTAEWTFRPDKQYIMGQHENSKLTARTIEPKPCAMVVDGFGVGAVGTLTSLSGYQRQIDGPGQPRPHVQLHPLSQFPSVDLLIDGDPIVQITPEDCDIFDCRVLPTTHIDEDGDVAWISQELRHQWPGCKFAKETEERQDASRPTYVGEVIVTLKRGVQLPLKTTAMATSSSITKFSIIQRVQGARHIRLAFVARDDHERACFEWFRIILTGSKSVVNRGLWANGESSSSLWAYTMDDSLETRSLDALISNVVEGVQKTDEPEFPVVPVFLIDRKRGTINSLDLPDEKSGWSSLRHITASLILGAARAMQHQHLVHNMIKRNTHSATFSHTVHSEFTTVTADISLRTKSPHAELLDIGESILLSVLSANQSISAEIIPRAVGSQLSASFTLSNSDPICELMTRIVSESGVQHIRLDLSPVSRLRAVDEIQQLATFTASSPISAPNSNKFDIASRLTGHNAATFYVPASVVGNLNPLKTEVINRLRVGLKGKQVEAFDMSLDRLLAGYLNIQGPDGTGKSFVGIRIALALACTQPVLIVATNNEVVSQIESALITQYKSLLEACPEAVDIFKLARLFPRNHVRNDPRLSLLHQTPPKRQSGESISEMLWGPETQGHDLTLDHLAYRYAHHIKEKGSTDSALDHLSEEYCQEMKLARQSEHKGHPEKLASLDRFNNGLGAHLLAMMNVVVATIDTAASRLELYHPRCLIFDEAATTLVHKGVSLIKKFDPAIVITMGDVQGTGPIVPSALASFNEFGSLLERSLVEQLHPSERQTVTLDINFRNPPSCWEFPRRMCFEKAQVNIESVVDVRLQPKFSAIVQASKQPGFFKGCLRSIDLTRNQQIFISVPQGHCRRVPQGPFDQAGNMQGDAPCFKTSEGTSKFRSAVRTQLRNPAVHDAVERLTNDLLEVSSITKEDVLVQCLSEPEREDLEQRLSIRAKDINLLSTTGARGQQYPIVITVVNACNCSYDDHEGLTGDQELNVALTRVQTCHFIVGNCDCLRRINRRGGKSPYLLRLADYMNHNSHRVNFWTLGST